MIYFIRLLKFTISLCLLGATLGLCSLANMAYENSRWDACVFTGLAAASLFATVALIMQAR
jgi:hypothetical protein